MINRTGRAILWFFIVLMPLQLLANTIRVTVKTNEEKAAAIGFMVGKKQLGGLGKSYTGEGPKNKVYRFGYKKDSPFGANIDCGTVMLTRDSTVILEYKNNKCSLVLTHSQSISSLLKNHLFYNLGLTSAES